MLNICFISYIRLSYFFLFLLSLIILGCSNEKKYPIKWNSNLAVKDSLDDKSLQNWHLKDIITDSIAGISFYRAKDLNLIRSAKEKTIIAVLDTEIDIKHEFLKNTIWTNQKEIPNNHIDDDKNGYIDDINGWNFLGNKKGDNLIYQNDESIRIIRTYEKDSLNSDISKELYIKAEKVLDVNLQQIQSEIEYVKFLRETYPKSKEFLKQLYPLEDYSTEALDSLYVVYEKKDSKVADLIYFMSDYLKYNLSKEWVDQYETTTNNSSNFIFNRDYNDRYLQGDDENNKEDIIYGNNRVSENVDELYHGTQMASIIIGANNSSGIKGICQNCLIMPVCISANGSEHDKDIAAGIRYAVDNGARIINMSFGKQLSLRNTWVLEAIKYAEENNVLIVTSAGNNSLNLDNAKHEYFPNDLNNGREITESFLMVGSSSYLINEDLLSYFSNFGKKNVDILAPGEMVNTAKPHNEYYVDSGTSISSALVSGIAGIVISNYPELTSKELKKVIMASGIKIDLKVNVSFNTEEKVLKPFDEITKSGRIVNLYNALIMADSIYKQN